MDFGIFGFTPEQVQEFRTFVAHQQAQNMANTNRATGADAGDSGLGGAGAGDQQQQRDNNGSGNGNEQRQQQEEPVLMHNAQHSGVVCDNCNTEIRGFRYKCMQCPDFDLCSKCEHKGHHAGHIMMRISFPEQARDAIRRYVNNGSCPPSPPHGHRGHGAPEPFPFLRRASVPCHRRGGHGHHGGHGHGPSHGHGHNATATPGGETDRPGTAPGCPYDMGKKEFKKWSKWMKRAAAHQHRSAEAYARAAASGNGNTAAGTSASAEAGPDSPVDFAAVASQIQEFLNYWGIPVDVVELYDQFGNGGRGTEASNATTTQTAGQQDNSEQQPQTQQTATPTPVTPAAQTVGASATAGNSGIQEQQTTSPAAVALSNNMQQMRIDDSGNDRAAGESLLMDLDADADNAGWTIVDNSREQTPGTSITVVDAVQPTSLTSPVVAEPNGNAQPSNASSGSMDSNNSSGSVRFASAGSNASSGPTPTGAKPSAPAFPNGIPIPTIPSIPLYPALNLNPPQIQQILQGVSSAVNSVVRSIPIVTDPRGPVGTNVTASSGGQVPSTGVNAPSGQSPVELDARCIKTLNQLLAMGFSNEGGYLTRLVSAKNGDLEAVLSSLFPN